MNKITKTEVKGFVKLKLSTDPLWAQRALLRIYQFQTQDEQNTQSTVYSNGVGFTGTDGKILTSLAKQLQKYGRLSEKQMVIVMRKMPKYWSQIVRISNSEKLHVLINEKV